MARGLAWNKHRHRGKRTRDNMLTAGIPPQATIANRKFMIVGNTEHRRRQLGTFTAIDKFNEQREREITEKESARLKATLDEFAWKEAE